MGTSNSTTGHHSSGPPPLVACRPRGLRMPSSIAPPSTQDCRAVKSAHLSTGFYFFAGPRQSLRSPFLTASIPPGPDSITASAPASTPSLCGLAPPSVHLYPQAICNFDICQGSDSGPGSSLCTNLRKLRVTPEF